MPLYSASERICSLRQLSISRVLNHAARDQPRIRGGLRVHCLAREEAPEIDGHFARRKWKWARSSQSRGNLGNMIW